MDLDTPPVSPSVLRHSSRDLTSHHAHAELGSGANLDANRQGVVVNDEKAVFDSAASLSSSSHCSFIVQQNQARLSPQISHEVERGISELGEVGRENGSFPLGSAEGQSCAGQEDARTLLNFPSTRHDLSPRPSHHDCSVHSDDSINATSRYGIQPTDVNISDHSFGEQKETLDRNFSRSSTTIGHLLRHDSSTAPIREGEERVRSPNTNTTTHSITIVPQSPFTSSVLDKVVDPDQSWRRTDKVQQAPSLHHDRHSELYSTTALSPPHSFLHLQQNENNTDSPVVIPPPFHHSHSTPLSSSSSHAKRNTLSTSLSVRERTKVRPVPIHHPYTQSSADLQRPPSASASASASALRHSPYNIPLPLSSGGTRSLRSAKGIPGHMQQMPSPLPPPLFSTSVLRTPPLQQTHSSSSSTTTPTRKIKIEPGDEDDGQFTPPGRTSSSPARPIASPSGSMSTTLSTTPSKRRAPPTFPCSPRRETITSHREIIARSAGLPPLGSAPHTLSHTPNALRVPPSAQWSPAFHRSGYNRANHSYHTPYPIPPSPSQQQYLHNPPHSAGPAYHRRPMPNSAPMVSSPRVPDQPKPPSPEQIVKTAKGTFRYKDVSVAWVVAELNKVAPKYWFNPPSADCKVIIPWTTSRRRSRPPSATEQSAEVSAPDSGMSVHSNQLGHSYWPPTPVGPVLPPQDFSTGIGRGEEDVISGYQIQRDRRGSLPEYDQVPVMVFSLHQDYLITQSKLFRQLLSSTPAHLDMPLPESTNSPQGDGTVKGAKMMPMVQGEIPSVCVPLPDPESFGLIVHWLYWGDESVIEKALSNGLVSWQGLVKSIDYLDLEAPIKRTVGKWWRRWIKTEPQTERAPRSRAGPSDAWFDEDDDDDTPPGRKARRFLDEVEPSDGGSEGGEDADMDGEDRETDGDDEMEDSMLGALKNL